MSTQSTSLARRSAKFFTRAISLVAVVGVAAEFAAPRSAEAGSLTWAFTFSNGIDANVTVNATPVTLATGTTYSITSITGTIGTLSGVCQAGPNKCDITGLNTTFNTPSNQFQYNPTLSPNDPTAFFTNFQGISFNTSETAEWNIYFNVDDGTFQVANSYETNSSYFTGQGVQSGVIPVPGPPAPIPTPGPLPILGASAAFGMSRRLRRRIITSG